MLECKSEGGFWKVMIFVLVSEKLALMSYLCICAHFEVKCGPSDHPSTYIGERKSKSNVKMNEDFRDTRTESLEYFVLHSLQRRRVTLWVN